MASTTKQKSPLRGLMWALLFTLVGLGMVAGGIYGLVDTFTGDDDDDSPAAASVTTTVPDVSFDAIGAKDPCDAIDPRLSGKETLTIRTVDGSGGSGTAGVRCGGSTAFFDIEIPRAVDPEKYVFAEAWLYSSKKKNVKLGTTFYQGNAINGLVGVPPGVDIQEYKSLVLVPRAIDDDSTKPSPIRYRVNF